MAKKENLPAKQESKSLAVQSEYAIDEDLLDALPRAEQSDFQIPRLTLIQPTSKIAGEGGDLVDSATGQAVSGKGKALKFVPVFFFKDIAITNKETGKWIRNEIKGPENAHKALYENRVTKTADGIAEENKERLNLFVVLASDLDEPLPQCYRILIKASSFKSAKTLISAWEIDIRTRQAPYLKLWTITPELVQDEKGKYYVLKFAKAGDAKNQERVQIEQMEGVKFWAKTLSQKKDELAKQDTAEDVEPSSDIPF